MKKLHMATSCVTLKNQPHTQWLEVLLFGYFIYLYEAYYMPGTALEGQWKL